MELTRETLEVYADHPHYVTAKMAQELLKVLDNPCVWDCAPEEANGVHITYSQDAKDISGIRTSYFRKLEKSRIDEIAEEVANTEFNRDIADRPAFPKRDVADIIKSAILQARKEWEAER